MTGLRIGPITLDTVPTGLHRTAIFPGESGFLRNGLLTQSGVVTIDAKAGRLILRRLPAESLSSPFGFSFPPLPARCIVRLRFPSYPQSVRDFPACGVCKDVNKAAKSRTTKKDE